MVLTNLYFNSISNLIDNFFYKWEDSIKPPMAVRQLLSEDKKSCTGVELQFAVAGFKEKDLEVYVESNVLYVKGSNIQNSDIDPRFRSEFKNSFPVSKDLDLSKTTIRLEDGLLSISIPLQKEESVRKYLLGVKDEPVLNALGQPTGIHRPSLIRNE